MKDARAELMKAQATGPSATVKTPTCDSFTVEEQHTTDLPSPIGETSTTFNSIPTATCSSSQDPAFSSPTQSFHSIYYPSTHSASSSCSSPSTTFSSLLRGKSLSSSGGYVSPETSPPSSPRTFHQRGESGVLVFHPGRSDPCFGSLPGHNRALSRPDSRSDPGLSSPSSSIPPVTTFSMPPPPIVSLPPLPMFSPNVLPAVHTMPQGVPAPLEPQTSSLATSVNALSLESSPSSSTSVNQSTNASLPAITEAPIAARRRTSKSFKDMCKTYERARLTAREEKMDEAEFVKYATHTLKLKTGFQEVHTMWQADIERASMYKCDPFEVALALLRTGLNPAVEIEAEQRERVRKQFGYPLKPACVMFGTDRFEQAPAPKPSRKAKVTIHKLLECSTDLQPGSPMGGSPRSPRSVSNIPRHPQTPSSANSSHNRPLGSIVECPEADSPQIGRRLLEVCESTRSTSGPSQEPSRSDSGTESADSHAGSPERRPRLPSWLWKRGSHSPQPKK